VTWFQAEQACRLSGKRLLSNQEWQAAAHGTPDPGDADDGVTTCNTNAESLIPPGTSDPQYAMPTGSRSACISRWGTHDMIGNVWEWVADWTTLPVNCTNWPSAFGDDISCVGSITTPPTPAVQDAGATEPGERPAGSAHDVPTDQALPTVYSRGGNMADGARNGIFAIFAGSHPSLVSRSTGFRCGR
jgi:formylglycine-generating enzyme required for sulfatase activity